MRSSIILIQEMPTFRQYESLMVSTILKASTIEFSTNIRLREMYLTLCKGLSKMCSMDLTRQSLPTVKQGLARPSPCLVLTGTTIWVSRVALVILETASRVNKVAQIHSLATNKSTALFQDQLSIFSKGCRIYNMRLPLQCIVVFFKFITRNCMTSSKTEKVTSPST